MELLTSNRKAGYPTTATRLRQARQLVHEIIAEQVAESLNKYVRTLPHETLADKQQLAHWLNRELRSLGLAIRAPGTNEASFLRGAVARRPTGRFQLCIVNDAQNGRPFSSNELFELDFMAFSDRGLGADEAGAWVKKALKNRASNQTRE